MVYRNPLEAYQTVSKAAMNGPETEAAVLTKAALRLKDCQDNWESPDCDERLFSALRYTQKIWSVFQAELSDRDNPLPKAMRLDLLRLSAFIDKRCFEILAFPDRKKISLLIDINNNIAAGLRQQARQAGRPERPESQVAAASRPNGVYAQI